MIMAGDFRTNIVLQNYTYTVGDRGQTVKTWTSYANNVPAVVEELGGRKLELARQQVANATHKITMRYDSRIKVMDRAVLGSKALGIGSITDLNYLHFLMELLCSSEELGADNRAVPVSNNRSTFWGDLHT